MSMGTDAGVWMSVDNARIPEVGGSMVSVSIGLSVGKFIEGVGDQSPTLFGALKSGSF